MGIGKPSKTQLSDGKLMPRPQKLFNLNNPSVYWPKRDSSEPKVLIVGAGAAGLTCAARLLDAGFKNILVLEAENRSGGRIHTVEFGSNIIDLGAQWCHGEKGNIVFEMVQEKGLLGSDGDTFVYESAECIRSNGEVVAFEIVEILKNIVVEVFQELQQNNAEQFENNVSFASYLSEHFFRKLSLPQYEHIDTDVAEEFFENYKKVESSESSSPLEEMSAYGLTHYWECAGNYLLNWQDNGYVAFLELLLGLKNGTSTTTGMGSLEGHVVCNATVTNINWQRSDNMVEVKCLYNKHEHVFLVNHVILTVSLGVLKHKYRTLFQPQLPKWKLDAIIGLGYGNVCKIYLEFPTPFWPETWTGLTTLWRHEDSHGLRDTTIAWTEDVFGFYRVSQQPTLLQAWLVGSHVVYVERLPIETVRDGCMNLLKRFLPAWSIEEPIAVSVTKWTSNPNFRGAYSFRSLETERRKTSAVLLSNPIEVPDSYASTNESVSGTKKSENLSENTNNEGSTDGDKVANDNDNNDAATDADDDVKAFKDATSFASALNGKLPVPVILFAGEATSPHYYSTVHGAVESGEREATRLKRLYTYIKKPGVES